MIFALSSPAATRGPHLAPALAPAPRGGQFTWRQSPLPDGVGEGRRDPRDQDRRALSPLPPGRASGLGGNPDRLADAINRQWNGTSSGGRGESCDRRQRCCKWRAAGMTTSTKRADALDLEALALAYLAGGLSLVPCSDKTKRPEPSLLPRDESGKPGMAPVSRQGGNTGRCAGVVFQGLPERCRGGWSGFRRASYDRL